MDARDPSSSAAAAHRASSRLRGAVASSDSPGSRAPGQQLHPAFAPRAEQAPMKQRPAQHHDDALAWDDAAAEEHPGGFAALLHPSPSQVLSLGRMSWEEHSSILGAGAGSSGELSGLLHMDTRLASAYSTLAGPADADAAPSGLPSPTGGTPLPASPAARAALGQQQRRRSLSIMATPPRRRGRLALQLASAASLPGPPVADHHVLEGGDARPALLLPWPLPAPLGGPWAADAPQVPLRSGEAPAQEGLGLLPAAGRAQQQGLGSSLQRRTSACGRLCAAAGGASARARGGMRHVVSVPAALSTLPEDV